MPVPSPAFSRPATLRHYLACDPAEVRPALLAVRQFLAEHSWSEEDLLYFELAMAEALNNAIAYASAAGKTQPIMVEALSDAGSVEFRLHDHTPGFDWPERIELPDAEDERGRGLFLMTRKMDYAGYFRGAGENILILRKQRAQPATQTSPESPVLQDIVEELSSCYESLSAIFRYGAELGQAGKTEEFARRLLGDLLGILTADWFVLRLAKNAKLEVCVASEPAQELPAVNLEESSSSFEAEAARTRQTVWFGPGRQNGGKDPLTETRPGASGLVHPIVLGGELIGTLAAGVLQERREGSELPFTAAQTNVVNTFADFLAIQIANSRFQAEQLRQQLVTHELEIARNIQRSLLPKKLPAVPGFNLAAFCRSAHEVGGDFYDAVQVDETSVLLAIADVMGKGIPAAMFAAVLRNLLRASPELRKQPAELMGRVNRLLYEDLSELEMFITAQLAFVDGASRRIAVANAGHCPLAIASGNMVRALAPEGMPLGIKANTVFETAVAELPGDSRALMFSDGLTEAMDTDGNAFGLERLIEWLKVSTQGHSAQRICEDLVSKLDKHRGQQPLRDDQTLLLLTANP